MKRAVLTLALCAIVTSCNRGDNKEGPTPPQAAQPPAAPQPTPVPAIDQKAILERIKVLSSDEFEGRKPATKGEDFTVR